MLPEHTLQPPGARRNVLFRRRVPTEEFDNLPEPIGVKNYSAVSRTRLTGEKARTLTLKLPSLTAMGLPLGRPRRSTGSPCLMSVPSCKPPGPGKKGYSPGGRSFKRRADS